MRDMVKDYMIKEIATINAGVDIATAAKKMAATPRGYLVVLDKGAPVGIITERNLVNEVLAKGRDPSKTKVSEVMSSPLVTVDPEASLIDAAEIMKKNNVRKLPVVREGILYGIVTARDITDHFRDYVDELVRDMLQWIPSFTF